MQREVNRGAIWALFACSCTLLGLFVLALIEPASADYAATPHPEVESMLHSGSGAPGGMGAIWAGTAFGLLVIAMIGICVLMGADPKATRLRQWIVGSTIAYLGLFGLLMRSYAGYTRGGPLETFLGLPTPSAWMVYGVWLFPWVFIFAYVVTFRTAYYPPESEERFERLIREKGEQGGAGAGH